LNNLIVDGSAEEREEILQQFRHVVGPILILVSPLSTSALSRMLDLPREVIDGSLDMLHSVLDVPPSADEPVRLLYLSFRDFVFKKSPGNTFWVDEKQAHVAMAISCLRVMGSLRQDICQLRAPGTHRSAIHPRKIDDCLPPEVQYACLYWVSHMQDAGNFTGDCEEVLTFLRYHFLHWVEASSLMGRTWEILPRIKTLQSLYKVREMLQDMRDVVC
jgi:hypothetical protein